MAKDNFYPKGEFVFREGESADFAYILKIFRDFTD